MKRKKYFVFCFILILFLFQEVNLSGSSKFEIKDLIGTWTGHGAGSEVRYRHKLGLLTLTVKHTTEFVFVVNKEGKIEGEGSIKYELTNNTTGLDDLVASVHSLMGLAKVPGMGIKSPFDKSGKQDSEIGKTAEDIGKMATDVKGVTKIQYDAPHLKNGPQIRHFKFTGQVKKDVLKDKAGKKYDAFLIELDEVKDFTQTGGKPNNTLIAEYEVNKVKTESKFPCWSPFIDGTGVVRKGPGKVHIAEFQQEGKHRKGKKVWQEYGYVWLARQVNPET
jgi:hypothetical protein